MKTTEKVHWQPTLKVAIDEDDDFNDDDDYQVRQIKMMIAKAQSLEEVERLNQMLRNGQMPGMETQNGTNGGEQEEMEQ